MTRSNWLAVLTCTACLAAAGAAPAAEEPTKDQGAPVTLAYPQGYREWIFLTSGLGMNYSALPESGHSAFDNVFVQPTAYRAFLDTGRWPDGTLLVKEARKAEGRGSINRHGQFQAGPAIAVEVHAKDSKRYAGGWAFFEFSGTDPATMIPTAASCYECHAKSGAVDTTFVQFYPTLLPVARRLGTAAP